MKSTNYLVAIIFICVLHFNNSYSQSNFIAGYVIDIHKDTIRGFIDYRNWDKTPKDIVFNTVSDSKVTIYNTHNIRGFSVAGENYVSGIVTIDESPFRDNELTESGKPQYRADTVFLQILFDGPKSLYYLKDKNLKVHFFIDQNGIYVTLGNMKYLKNIDGASYVQTNEKFKGQLSIYLQDCSSIQKKIIGISYSKNDLIELFNEYYKCTHDGIINQHGIIYQYQSEKIKSEIGILAGLSLTQLKLVGNDPYYLSLINTDYPLSNNFTFGVFYNIILPRKKGKWSINNELMYTSYKTNGLSLDSNNVDIYTKTYTSIGASYIKLNTLLKFRYPIKGMFLFMDGGISNGIAISETNYFKSEYHVYSAHYVSETEALQHPRRWEKGFILGLGSSYKNYSFEFGFERADGMSTYQLLSSPVKRYSFILGYKF